MAQKITKELLLSLGISEKAANAAIEKLALTEVKPKFYRVKMTAERAAKLAADNPDLIFERKVYDRKPKEQPLPF